MKKQLVLSHVLGGSGKKTFLKMQFGGDLQKGKRKTKRVLVSRRYVHVVMRSPMAKGRFSLLKRSKWVEATVREQAKKQHIKVFDFANMGNHLHILIKIMPRGRATNEAFAGFTRALAGLIARKILDAQRGAPVLEQGQAFWPSRPYTRVLSNTREDYRSTRAYFTLNLFEAIGFERKKTYLPLARGPT